MTPNLLQRFRNRVLFGDCIHVMRQLPAHSVPLIVTSPPYNLRRTTGNSAGRPTGGIWSAPIVETGYDGYSDDLPRDAYIQWQRTFLIEALKILHPDGAIFYVHKWRVQAGLLDRIPDEITRDLPVRQIIVWQRHGGYNFNAGYFLPTTEIIYLIARSGFKLAPRANHWGDVWKIRQETRNPHPAPFPVELARRCIESTTADVVLDPFLGSGTTAVAALEAGRDWIGIERAPTYQQMAWQRFRKADLGFRRAPRPDARPAKHQHV